MKLLIIGCGYLGTAVVRKAIVRYGASSVVATTTDEATRKTLRLKGVHVVNHKNVPSLVASIRESDRIVLVAKSQRHTEEENASIQQTHQLVHAYRTPQQRIIWVDSLESNDFQTSLRSLWNDEPNVGVVRCSQLIGDAPDRTNTPRNWKSHLAKIQKILAVLPGDGLHPVEYSDVVEVANEVLDSAEAEAESQGSSSRIRIRIRIRNAVRSLPSTRKEWYDHCAEKWGMKSITWDPSKPTLPFMASAEVIDLVIVGGGISGCATAHGVLKSRPDTRLVVLEGSGRAGGRCYSTDFGGERGGESIGMHYSRVTELCDELGVAYSKEDLSLLHTGININYHTNGEWVSQSEWAKWANHPLTEDSPWKQASPMFLFHMLVAGLKTPETWEQHLDCPSMRELASISVKDFVMRSKVPPELVRYIESNNHMINANWEKLPMLVPYITMVTSMGFKQDGYFAIKGGNEMLIRALCKKLPILLRHRVLSDTMDSSGVHVVECANGRVFRAKKVVYALPGNKVKCVSMQPPLQGIQKEALSTIQYTVTRKTYFRIKPEVYWKQHDGRPDLMWFVDSDIMNMSVIVNGWGSDRRISKRDDHHYWGFYVVTNGTRAEHCQRLEAEGHDVAQMMLEEIIRLRPCFKDAIELAGSFDWGQDHDCIEGAFHYYPISPKVPSYYDHISKPSNGRYFAGEYTEYKSKGMHAAINSSDRVLRELDAQNQVSKI